MPRHAFPTLHEAAAALAAGRVTAEALVEEALARIADPVGEGARAFVKVHADSARAAAAAQDRLRRAGRAPSRFAGLPVTVKDLFDEAGEVTRAGSVALHGASPAPRSAPVVERLERSGFVILGRTNMTEFAFSGLGVNPHYGTPKSPWERGIGHLPGGSSSGAGVAAADGMGFGGLGSDTGGSCRIPAALCGVVGWKPTARRVPLAGALPLSFSLDSIGPLARSVADCAVLDAVISGEGEEAPAALPLAGVRLGRLRNYVEEGTEPAVAQAFEAALRQLEAAGARIEDMTIPELDTLPSVNGTGGFAASEAWTWHETLIAAQRDAYDPRILKRILRGERMSAADYIRLLAARREMIAAAAARTAGFDAVVCPTVPLRPPMIAAVEAEADYNRINLLLLRNTSVANFLDRCAISVPCHAPGEAPVGLMLMGEAMGDSRLFALSRAVEEALG
ncbi:MAG: amidase [Acetobacteraceae bacterium]|nr:amidase [Acetobacteraceae bacterium]